MSLIVDADADACRVVAVDDLRCRAAALFVREPEVTAPPASVEADMLEVVANAASGAGPTGGSTRV